MTLESTFQQPIRRHVRRFTVSRTPPFRSVSLITEQLARRPPRRAALGALLSHVAPHGIGTPLARRTSWHLGSRQSARTARNLAPGGRLSEQSRSIGPCWSPRGFREPPKPALDSPSPGEYQRDERASDRRVARPRVKPRLSKTAALARRPLHTTAARCHSYYLPVWLQLVQVTPRWIQLNQLPEEKAISEWQERRDKCSFLLKSV